MAAVSSSPTSPSSKSAAAAASSSTSHHVYIKSEEYAWVPARLMEADPQTAKVSIPQYATEQAMQSDGGRGAKKFTTAVIALSDYAAHGGSLPLQNVDEEGHLKEVEDMVDLPFLHEAAILYNLKMRHVRKKPYTRTGDIIIACNPYQWFDHLYSERVRSQYADTLVWQASDPATGAGGGGKSAVSTLEPHVYETSSLAYRGLAVEGVDQSILVSGESGAGKTETVKILLSDIASVQRGPGYYLQHPPTTTTESSSTTPLPNYQSPIVQRILDSNPLLEAFGNAKTRRNDNSSRFGKFIQLQFDQEDPMTAAFSGRNIPACVLAGSKCEVYLLEKSRVIMHDEEERTFHIFYQLLAADESIKTQFWSGLAETDQESFTYVGYSATNIIEGKSDAERFQHTVDSLALVGIKDDLLTVLMRSICIVLQLGNLLFESHPTDETRTVISSQDELQALAELMGLGVDDLTASLTIRTMRARNEDFKVPLNAVQTKESCDAFAKEIYAKTFLWLVRTINDATCAEKNYDGPRKSDFGMIGLLDIFGFESFDTNRFEQLCINYANEKLQQKFTQDIFRTVQEEYQYEGIELGEVTYDDNTDVLDLIEGRMGLLAVLNEECLRPGGSDKGFVSKVHAMNKDSECFIREKRFEECEFGIRHYAGSVVYDANGFVTKNMDTLPSDLQACATRSSNQILAKELGNESMMNTEPAAVKKRPPGKAAAAPKARQSNIVGQTVWTKFKTQLVSLMSSLQKTRTRYIRCIKPNVMKQPLIMQHVSTVEQLRCAGVVAAITISRSAFPNRLEHDMVLERFKSIWRKGQHLAALEAVSGEDMETKPKHLVDYMLSDALKSLETTRNGASLKAFVMGKTRTYFRAGALEYLENERLRRLGSWAVEIERIVRMYLARSQYLRQRKASVVMETYGRRRMARRRYKIMRQASILLQCWRRCVVAKRTLIELNRNHKAALIQTHWRMVLAIAFLKSHLRAAVQVQRIVRGAIQRPKFRAALHERREEKKLENQVLALQRKLEEAEAKRLEAERKAEDQARRAKEQYAKMPAEEKKDEDKRVVAPISTIHLSGRNDDDETDQGEQAALSPAAAAQLSAQQQKLMDESGKMLEYLRKEVFKLRSQNAQMRADFDLLKDNNQRLMDANASAGASFAALNQHTKQLARTNEKMGAELTSYKQQVQKLSVTQIELKEELKMKQATYVAEVHSRLQYQKALSRIVDLVQDKCRDTRLVEEILRVADACESEYMSGPTGLDAKAPLSLFATPPAASAGKNGRNSGNDSSYLMSSIRSFWS